MSYEVLARKWRPNNFEEMVGQSHVLRALASALDNQRLHHAYLFTGTRGVGKTTIARILARSLNCDEGVSSKPCGICSSCTEISEGRFVDLIEVDAASKTKVDDTRELLENVQYRPTRGRYKVYLIDEVHMLSTHSFNALLKTLEEPPPHVVFLLATTDPQKLLPTVLSRCLQFHLKNMQPTDISNHLEHILKQEDIEFEIPALEALSWSAKGSMRDALSLLDQAIAFGDGRVTDSEVREMLGTIDRDEVYRIITAVAENNGTELMTIIEQMSQFAPDYSDVLAEVLRVLHRVAIVQQIPDAEQSTNDHLQIEQLANTISAEDIQLFYQLAMVARKDLPYAPEARSGFEMCLLRMMCFKPKKKAITNNKIEKKSNVNNRKKNTDKLTKMPSEIPIEPIAPVMQSPLLRNQQPENAIKQEVSPVNAPQVIPQAIPQAIADVVEADVADSVVAEEKNSLEVDINVDISSNNWHQILELLDLTGVTEQIALNSQVMSISEDKLLLSLATNMRTMVNPEHINKISAAINHLYNLSLSVVIDASDPASETPRQRKERLAAEQHAKACDDLNSDHNVLNMVKVFDAKLDTESVESLTAPDSQP